MKTHGIQRFAALSFFRKPHPASGSAGKLVFLGIYICALQGVALSAELPALDVVRASYVESVTSIESIQYEMVMECVNVKEIPPHVLPPGLDPVSLWRVKVSQDGLRQARTTEVESESSASVRSWAGFNGKTFAEWRHSVTASPGKEQLPQGSISTAISWDVKEPALATLLGENVTGNESVERLLKRSGSRVAGMEAVDNIECVKVELAPHPGFTTIPGHTFQLVAWFDPKAGYLPRRLRLMDPNDAGRSPVNVEYVVSEFQQVDAGSGRQLWVPKLGEWRPGHGFTKWRMQFNNVVVNQPIPAKTFNPEFPFGTLVREELPDHKVRHFYAGGVAGEQHYRELHRAHIAAAEKLKAAQTPGLVDGMFHLSAWMTWMLVFAAVLCLGLAVRAVLRRKYA